ncbi:MAG TPA: HIT family protein [Candidatus Saccharimonadales bacterium]|nr:HIT family protein [Candidatus Saccharimonadales bacterium]
MSEPTNEPTIFDKLVAREIPAYIVWESETYMAFLTPFANTPGATVVIPKTNPGDYVFNLDDAQMNGLMAASKTVAKLLEKAFGTDRVALVFEGEAVPHVHAKLYPMHNFKADRSQLPKAQVFFPSYPGYIDTHDGPKMSDEQLAEIQQKITGAAQ